MPGPSRVTARIYTPSGGWGLPTIDPDSLAAIALLRFADIPFSVSPGASPSMTHANQLPVVVFDNPSAPHASVCAGLPALIALFTADLALPDANAHLTPFMIAESSAFATLITARFGPALSHELYLNDKNYADLYHTLLSKETAFPLNRVLPFLQRRRLRAQLADRTPDALHFDAGIALAALSTRLGDRSRFFYQDKPSVLDAIAFGYLAPLLYIPLPSTNLRGQVAKFSNLVSFVSRVQQQYFRRDGERLVGELDGDSVLEARRKHVEDEARDTAPDESGARDSSKSAEESKAEDERTRWNQYFVWGSIGVFAAHVLLGNEIEFDYE